MTLPVFWHAALICVTYATFMLVQDTVWSVSTKAIASNKTLLGATFNAIGDGLGKVVGIITITLVAHSLSFSIEVAQVLGNMIGAFIGVFVGSQVSILLDRLIAGYHRSPNVNPLGVVGSLGIPTKVVDTK